MDFQSEREYERLTQEYHSSQLKLLPRKTWKQHVAENWTTAVAVIVIIIVPMALALKGAIF